MNIEAAPTIKNPPAQFAGDLWVDMIAAPHTADQRMTVAVVRFGPGARTAWHSHARGCFGLTEDEIIEAITHLAFYTGWPRAMSAIAEAQKLFGTDVGGEERDA